MKESEANFEDEIAPEPVIIADDQDEDSNEVTEPLPLRQERALRAVLTHSSLKAAALAAGCSDTTLWRYMNEPPFARRLRRARSLALDHAVTRIHRDAGDAVSVLREIMMNADAPAGARITAAQSFINNAARFGEIDDLKTRMEDLQDLFRAKQEEEALAALPEEEEDR